MTIDVERRYREALEQARDRLQSISAHVHPLDEMTESDLHSISQDWWFGTQEIETTLDRAAEYGTPASQETAPFGDRQGSDLDDLREALDNAIDVVIYPKSSPDGPRTPWQRGWNAACMAIGDALDAYYAALAPKEADHE